MSETQETPQIHEASPADDAQPAEGRGLPTTLRRIGAAVIDATSVAVPTGALALAVSERFPILTDIGGRPQFSGPDQARIDAIDQGFNRAIRLGDQVFTLSGGRWWLAVLALVVTTLIVFVAIPSRRDGRTFGKQVMGLADPAHHVDDGPEIIPLDELLSEFGVSTTPIDLDGKSADDSKRSQPADGGGDGERSGSVVDMLRALAGTAATGTPESDTESEPDDDSGLDPENADIYTDVDDARVTADAHGPENASDAASRVVTTAASDRSSAFADLILAESSLSESPLNATVATRSEQSRELEWSDTWKAWTYQDPATGSWFRHDTESGRWLPIG